MTAIGLALLSALGFGSAAVFARVGMLGIRPVPSTLISAVASFIPTAILAVIFAFSDIRALPAIAGLQTARKGIVYVALSGLASALGVITLYFALQKSDVVIVAPISSISPLVTLLLAYLFLDRLENVTRWLLLGTILAVVGVALVILGSTL